MLDFIRRLHVGETIRIVASGPSAKLFKWDDRPTIAVNGAAFLDTRFDYFLCGDKNAYTRDWFGVDCSNIRIIARLVARNDRILYPDDDYPDLRRIAVPQHEQRKVSNLPRPVAPHLIFSYKWYAKGRLAEDMNFLMFSGTISCCAVQLAYLMGAKEIELFGCNFHHSRRSHYFYPAERGQVGRVRPSQRQTMDKLLKEVRCKGVRVTIFGQTKLTEFDRQCQ